MTMIRPDVRSIFRKTAAATLTMALVLGQAGPSLGQATPATAHLPQPHLARALQIAAGENAWRHPALLTCYTEQAYVAQEVIRNPPAARVFDNLYFVGNGIVSAWALDTPDGIVLIDTMNNPEEADRFILSGLRSQGLDPARIKVLLVSHGHGDHIGAAKYLQEKFGAKVYMTRADYDMAGRRTGDKGRPQPRLDVEMHDGDSVTLGGMTVKAFVTPGHTEGALSFLLPVTDKGRATKVLFLGGITNRRISPAMHAGYEAWTSRMLRLVPQAGVESVIGNHPSYDDTASRIAYRRLFPQGPNPFLVGQAESVRYLRVLQECNRNNTDIERHVAGIAEPKRGDSE